ncbi:MAG: APC family permease [Acidobacteria bacterium]|nr:APC family permease [Acidobacteriota bacterium]
MLKASILRPRVVVATTAMLSFISFWRAAAIVLNDLGSSAFYVGGISEQAMGKSAPWFVFAVMSFSFCVRMVYIESSSMFVRGGVYRVVKEAMGSTLAKIAVSALVFDFILTAPISGVSAGQYLVGLVNEISMRMGYPLQLPRDTTAAGIAILIIFYFWRKNIIGIEESSAKAMNIMKVATIMVVLLVLWGGISILARGGELPPAPSIENLEFSEHALGWLGDTALPTIPLIAFLIGFGHSILAMSGEETLAQVYREIGHPKLKNLKRAAIIIFVFSLTFTSLVSFYALILIPDADRPHYHDNLISGVTMYLVGPYQFRLLFQAFVVIVGILMLAGAANTAIIGSNGILNRVSEDGVLADWFREPHKRYGTTYRIINLIAILQISVVIASRGDVFVLGEAYAFGVVWSFAMNSLSTLILRFKRPEEREWKVPLNIKLGRWELPLGLSLVTFILFATAVTNLFTKKVATISGILFTVTLYLIFVVSERINRARKLSQTKELERFNLEENSISPTTVGCRPGNVMVAVRDYRSLHHLQKILEKTNTKRQDIVVLTMRNLTNVNPGQHLLASDQVFTNYEQLLFSKVVEMAERAGKKVELVVVPGRDTFTAGIQAALAMESSKIAAGVSPSMSIEEQARRMGEAWEAAGPPARGLTLELVDRKGNSHFFDLGPHPPRLWPEDVDRVHKLWLKLSREKYGAKLHHRDIVGVALKRLQKDLESEERRNGALGDISREVEQLHLEGETTPPPVREEEQKIPGA